MKNNLVQKAACLLATAFFLMIAWATSRDDYDRNTLPLGVRLIDQAIAISNESSNDLDSLKLILNGVYLLDQVEIAANTSREIPLELFTDQNGATFPETEQAHNLLIYYEGNKEAFRGGYFQHSFE